MADLTINASDVSAGSGASKETGVAGVAINAGQLVYIVAATGKLALADADGSESSQCVGIAVNTADAAEQTVEYVTAGDVNITSGATVGTVYTVSNTSGGTGPDSDRTSNEYKSVFAYGKTASVLTVSRINTGVQVP